MRESRHGFRSTRASDADRDQAAERLRLAAGNGRLDVQELERRLERVYAATTYGELQAVVGDLPPDGQGDPVGYGDTAQIHQTGMNIVRRGQWEVPRRLVVDGRLGSTVLDFSRALIGHREVEIALDTDWSSVRIIVPKGAAVDTESLTIAWSSLTNSAASVPQKNAVRFRVTGSHRGGRVKIGYGRRFRR